MDGSPAAGPPACRRRAPWERGKSSIQGITTMRGRHDRPGPHRWTANTMRALQDNSRKAGAAVNDTETVGYVPGGFDMFHVGHLNILRKAREQCNRLVVGVATDTSLAAMKGRPPVIPHAERMELVAHINFVDDVITDYSQDKRLAWHAHPFDLLFKGDDWAGTPKGKRLEDQMAEVGVRVVYLPYTPGTSSTMLRQFLIGRGVADNRSVSGSPALLRG